MKPIADIILQNGRITTLDSSHPSATEVVIAGDKFAGVRDKAGNPTGMLIARPNATILYATLAKGPKLPPDYQYNSTRHFMRELNRLGVTSVCDAGGGYQNFYQGAAKDTDEHLQGLLSALRNRDEFVGELGETILFTPPSGSIPAKRFMVIGLGDEKDLSLDSLRVVGRIAAREAVRLKAKHVAWAPVIRDEGNTFLDVGEVDRAFIEQLLSAYDTEKRLQEQELAPNFSVEDFVIEAGPTYFEGAAKQVEEGIESIAAQLAQRNAAPYSSTKMQ